VLWRTCKSNSIARKSHDDERQWFLCPSGTASMGWPKDLPAWLRQWQHPRGVQFLGKKNYCIWVVLKTMKNPSSWWLNVTNCTVNLWRLVFKTEANLNRIVLKSNVPAVLHLLILDVKVMTKRGWRIGLRTANPISTRQSINSKSLILALTIKGMYLGHHVRSINIYFYFHSDIIHHKLNDK